MTYKESARQHDLAMQECAIMKQKRSIRMLYKFSREHGLPIDLGQIRARKDEIRKLALR